MNMPERRELCMGEPLALAKGWMQHTQGLDFTLRNSAKAWDIRRCWRSHGARHLAHGEGETGKIRVYPGTLDWNQSGCYEPMPIYMYTHIENKHRINITEVVYLFDNSPVVMFFGNLP